MTDLLTTAESAEQQTPLGDDELIARYIVRNPNGMGPDRAKAIWGVSVWALIGHMREEGNSPEVTAEDYGLPEIAVPAALAYYRQNRALIDARLLVHDAYFGEE